jgi:hypothetical protein
VAPQHLLEGPGMLVVQIESHPNVVDVDVILDADEVHGAEQLDQTLEDVLELVQGAVQGGICNVVELHQLEQTVVDVCESFAEVANRSRERPVLYQVSSSQGAAEAALSGAGALRHAVRAPSGGRSTDRNAA